MAARTTGRALPATGASTGTISSNSAGGGAVKRARSSRPRGRTRITLMLVAPGASMANRGERRGRAAVGHVGEHDRLARAVAVQVGHGDARIAERARVEARHRARPSRGKSADQHHGPVLGDREQVVGHAILEGDRGGRGGARQRAAHVIAAERAVVAPDEQTPVGGHEHDAGLRVIEPHHHGRTIRARHAAIARGHPKPRRGDLEDDERPVAIHRRQAAARERHQPPDRSLGGERQRLPAGEGARAARETVSRRQTEGKRPGEGIARHRHEQAGRGDDPCHEWPDRITPGHRDRNRPPAHFNRARGL